jgi:hypothetical protein
MVLCGAAVALPLRSSRQIGRASEARPDKVGGFSIDVVAAGEGCTLKWGRGNTLEQSINTVGEELSRLSAAVTRTQGGDVGGAQRDHLSVQRVKHLRVGGESVEDVVKSIVERKIMGSALPERLDLEDSYLVEVDAAAHELLDCLFSYRQPIHLRHAWKQMNSI